MNGLILESLNIQVYTGGIGSYALLTMLIAMLRVIEMDSANYSADQTIHGRIKNVFWLTYLPKKCLLGFKKSFLFRHMKILVMFCGSNDVLVCFDFCDCLILCTMHLVMQSLHEQQAAPEHNLGVLLVCFLLYYDVYTLIFLLERFLLYAMTFLLKLLSKCMDIGIG